MKILDSHFMANMLSNTNKLMRFSVETEYTGDHKEKHRSGLMLEVEPVSTSSGVMFFSEEDAA